MRPIRSAPISSNLSLWSGLGSPGSRVAPITWATAVSALAFQKGPSPPAAERQPGPAGSPALCVWRITDTRPRGGGRDSRWPWSSPPASSPAGMSAVSWRGRGVPGWRWGSSISSALLLLHCAVLLCSSEDSRGREEAGRCQAGGWCASPVSPQGPSTQLKLQTCTAALLKASQHCLLLQSLGRGHQKPKSREVQGRQDQELIWGEGRIFSQRAPKTSL